MARWLWVIRHAKSAEGSPGQRDFDRPLNARGERDGHKMQGWFAAQAHPATWLWTSPAARARATAEFAAAGFGGDLVEAPELYLAGTQTLLECLQATPQETTSVAIVAHNPGLTYLVNDLGREYVTDNLPTLGVARFRFGAADAQDDPPWTDLRPGAAELDLLTKPKAIEG